MSLQPPKTKKPAPTPKLDLERQISNNTDQNQNTVTSYPPLSTNASVTSFVVHDDVNRQQSITEIRTPEIEIEPPRPSCRKFKVDLVPEPLSRSDIPFERGVSIEGSLSNTSYTSNNVNGGDRSPSLVVPNIKDIFKMKNKIQSTSNEDGFESSTESDDGYLTLTKGTSITEMISPPIQKNARKEGVISDTIDKTNIKIEVFEKDQE